MVNLETKQKMKYAQLNEDTVEKDGLKVTYRLYMLDFERIKGYVIYVETDEDTEICLVGRDIIEASEMYNVIRRNIVTPCTLCDIIEDIHINR